MRCLVTGATGFAGRWLCRNLVMKGYQVVGWGRSEPTSPVPGVCYENVDICVRTDVRESLRNHTVDTVFHLAALANAAQCAQYPELAGAVNVTGTQNIVAVIPASVRLVFASTCHVYGQNLQLPIDESHPCNPVGPYAVSKYQAETFIRDSHANSVVIRAFHHTGPGQDPAYALADWANQIKHGAEHISVGNIDVRRDYCDVRDVVEGYATAAIKSPPGETYNLCSGQSHTLRDLLQILIADKTIDIESQANRFRQVDVPDMRGDAAKLRALGWSPKYDIEQTLRAMCDRN